MLQLRQQSPSPLPPFPSRPPLRPSSNVIQGRARVRSQDVRQPYPVHDLIRPAASILHSRSTRSLAFRHHQLARQGVRLVATLSLTATTATAMIATTALATSKTPPPAPSCIQRHRLMGRQKARLSLLDSRHRHPLPRKRTVPSRQLCRHLSSLARHSCVIRTSPASHSQQRRPRRRFHPALRLARPSPSRARTTTGSRLLLSS